MCDKISKAEHHNRENVDDCKQLMKHWDCNIKQFAKIPQFLQLFKRLKVLTIQDFIRLILSCLLLCCNHLVLSKTPWIRE